MTPGPVRLMRYPLAEVRGVVSEVRVVGVRGDAVDLDAGETRSTVSRAWVEERAALAVASDRWDAREKARGGRS